MCAARAAYYTRLGKPPELGGDDIAGHRRERPEQHLFGTRRDAIAVEGWDRVGGGRLRPVFRRLSAVR
jgi:hypothetical protein